MMWGYKFQKGKKDYVCLRGIQVPKSIISTHRAFWGGNGLKKKVCLAFRLEKKNKCVSSCSSFEMFPLSFDV